MHDSNPLATFSHVLHELNRFKLAYAHLIVSTEDDLRMARRQFRWWHCGASFRGR
jgi:hypothetical protein